MRIVISVFTQKGTVHNFIAFREAIKEEIVKMLDVEIFTSDEKKVSVELRDSTTFFSSAADEDVVREWVVADIPAFVSIAEKAIDRVMS